jgi:hypothetical protein
MQIQRLPRSLNRMGGSQNLYTGIKSHQNQLSLITFFDMFE